MRLVDQKAPARQSTPRQRGACPPLASTVIAAAWIGLLPQPGQAKVLAVGPGQTYTEVAPALAAANSGDTVVVQRGVYAISQLRPTSGVSLVGEDGPLHTELHAASGGQAIIVDDVTNVRIEGFDIHGENSVGSDSNALLYIEDSQNIVIRDCIVRDAPRDGDVVKINGSQNILVESSVIYNPSERTKSPGTFQENIDIRGHGDARITIRGSWLFHQASRGDYLIYAKGGTTDLLWENNIFGPSAGAGNSNVAVETGHLVRSDDTQYESENFVVRNNLFVAIKGTGAFAFAGPKVSWLYNNVFYRNDELRRALIELSANPAVAGGPGLKLFCFNNIFAQNGTRPLYRVRDAASGTNLVRDYNLYEPHSDFNDPASQGDSFALSDEVHSFTSAAPLFVAPTVPRFDPPRGTEQIAAILAGFRTQDASPARNAGASVWDLAASDHPATVTAMSQRHDAFGTERPLAGAWDIGLFQFAAGGPTDGGTTPTDASTGDSSTGDSSTGDSSTGDSSTGDSSTGDSSTGDSSTGDSSTGDSRADGTRASDGCSCEANGTPPEGVILFLFLLLLWWGPSQRLPSHRPPSPNSTEPRTRSKAHRQSSVR